MDAWGVDVVVSGSQKGLMLPPGAVLLRAVREGVGARQDLPAAEVLLRLRRRARSRWRRTRRTSRPPSPSCVGLREVLRMIEAEGSPTCSGATTGSPAPRAPAWRRWGSSSSPRPRRARPSPRWWRRAGIDSETILATYSASHNITIAGGQGEMKGKVFRLGHMGYVGGLRRHHRRSPRSSRCSTSWGTRWTSAPRVRAAQKVFAERGLAMPVRALAPPSRARPTGTGSAGTRAGG